jgi:hypothetical protein
MKLSEKSKGFGDTVEKFTTVTGIKKAVKVAASAVGVEDCGCEARRDSLNRMFPYDVKNQK